MGLHHKDVLREILGLSRKNRLQRFPLSGAGRHKPVENANLMILALFALGLLIDIVAV